MRYRELCQNLFLKHQNSKHYICLPLLAHVGYYFCNDFDLTAISFIAFSAVILNLSSLKPVLLLGELTAVIKFWHQSHQSRVVAPVVLLKRPNFAQFDQFSFSIRQHQFCYFPFVKETSIRQHFIHKTIDSIRSQITYSRFLLFSLFLILRKSCIII